MEFDYSKYCDSIEGNLTTALACQQFIASHVKNSESLRGKISNTKYANVMNLILNAIQQDFLLCVTKVWDRDTASWSLPGILDKYDWESEYASDPQKEEAEQQFRFTVDEFVSSAQMSSLRISRVEGFAHATDESRERSRVGEAKVASIQDIGDALDTALQMWNKFQFIAGQPVNSLLLLRTQFEPIADSFFVSISNLNEEESCC